MRKPRGLQPEERALWDQVAKRTTPIAKRGPLPEPVQVTPVVTRPKRQAQVIEPFNLGVNAVEKKPPHQLSTPLSERLSKASVQMDKKSFQKMSRGKISPEGRIDLHGMTLDQAHPALSGFMHASYGAQKRLVLVITGKGKTSQDDGPIPTRRGVLKHQVPQWLSMPPISHMVLEVREAHLKHGGSGAYYVYLRRHR